MIIDEIKKARVQAIKARDRVAADGLAVLTNKYMNASIEAKAKGKEMSDADTISLIQKALKELSEERDMYASNGREEKASEIQHQIDAVKVFLPQMMGEEEIRSVIESLSDRSMKNVMTTFKSKYAGKADMSLVGKIAREYQGK